MTDNISGSAGTGRLGDVTGLVLWLALSAVVAAFGGMFEPGQWYTQIARPDWTPPNWLFGPVWTFLYVAMAVAAWLVTRSGGWQGNRLALGLYLMQLLLNALWSWLFFGEHLIGLALIDIVCLFVLIAVVMVLFWRVRRAAGLLMLPYGLWVGFAAVLNYRFWVLN